MKKPACSKPNPPEITCHLGPFAVQLKFYQNTGRFPSTIDEIPETPLHYLSDQLDADVSGFRDYEWSGRTGARHRKEILNFLGIRRVSATDKQVFRLAG
ncbi:DUF4158 domain-containing protein [Salmonella enterica]|nr:DUF4158 domain-containing protein [Salmonella enterica]